MGKNERSVSHIYHSEIERLFNEYNSDQYSLIDDSIVAEQYASLSILEEIFQQCTDWLPIYKSARDRKDDKTSQAIWIAIVVTYSKVFGDVAPGRKKLVGKDVYKGHSKELLDMHDEIIEMRHKYAAHTDETIYHKAKTTISIRDIKGSFEIGVGFKSNQLLGLGKEGDLVRLENLLVTATKYMQDKKAKSRKALIEQWAEKYLKAKANEKLICENKNCVYWVSFEDGIKALGKYHHARHVKVKCPNCNSTAIILQLF